ncbi:hypothetical protein ACFXKS_01205 [Streptomyces scopuliridis]
MIGLLMRQGRQYGAWIRDDAGRVERIRPCRIVNNSTTGVPLAEID